MPKLSITSTPVRYFTDKTTKSHQFFSFRKNTTSPIRRHPRKMMKSVTTIKDLTSLGGQFGTFKQPTSTPFPNLFIFLVVEACIVSNRNKKVQILVDSEESDSNEQEKYKT